MGGRGGGGGSVEIIHELNYKLNYKTPISFLSW